MTRSAPHPWHGEPAPGARSVVVGVMPGHSTHVLRAAAELAAGLSAPLLCVWADAGRTLVEVEPDGTLVTTPLDPDHVDDGAHATAEQRLATQLEAELAGHPGPWRFLYAVGEVAAVLGRVAVDHHAWTIVVGARRPGFAGWMNQVVGGSLAGHLAHVQHVPVTVVPAAAG